jgi:integrase
LGYLSFPLAVIIMWLLDLRRATMPVGRISKRSVDAMQSEAKDAYLWDDELRGFGLKVTPAGRKVYLIQYRIGGRKGRTRRVTIGVHGVFTPDQARTEARRLLGEVAFGRDPAERRRSEATAATLGQVLDQFLVEHVDAKLKASSARECRRLERLCIPEALKRRPLAAVTREEVAKMHLSMKAKPYQGNRALALLSKFFNWCERHGYRSDGTNPCRHIEKYRERRRERFLNAEELARLGAALSEAESADTASPFVVAAIRLLALTGARLSEILTLQWQHVDLERSCLRLPDSKTGQKVIYLNPPALQVLTDLPRLEGNPYVIGGGKPGRHLVNLQKAWRRIRKAAGLDDVRIHDLRHSFASVAVAGGASLPIIGALLGHTQPQTTARYAHLSADPLAAATGAVGERIAQALGLPQRQPPPVDPRGA